MKRIIQKLTPEEKSIFDDFESGKLKSVSNIKAEKKRIQNMAISHDLKNRRVSL